MPALPFLDADTLAAILPCPQAIDALASALYSHSRLAAPTSRLPVPTEHGELLLMPAESNTGVGVKVLSVAPGNPNLGLARIQAVYILFDALTLTPRVLLDGTALTLLRTSALSALATQRLALVDASRLTVFGSGPQAEAHIRALAMVRPIRAVTIVSRNRAQAEALAERLATDWRGAVTVETALADGPDVVESADIVVCATTARQPVLDGDRLAARACVIAIGSHEPTARELDGRVFQRASIVVVEDRDAALREAGDVIMAIAAGAIQADQLVNLSELGDGTCGGGLTVFKSVGMGWQDLAVAEAACAAWPRMGADGGG